MENEIMRIPCEIAPITSAIEEIREKQPVVFPVADLPALGIVGNEVLNLYNSCITPGGEGIYRVTFPQGVSGTLSKFKTENAYLGSVRGGSGFSQARLTQLSINPEQLMMAFALMSINLKLNEILEEQAKILSFMYDVEESKIYAGINEINEAFEDYKINWSVQSFVNQGLSLARDKKADAQKALGLYKRQIEGLLSTPFYPHTTKKANKSISELNRFLSDLNSAYYLLAYATFFEGVLIKNFSPENIENFKTKMQKYADEYAALHTRSASWIKSYLTSAIDYKVAPVMRGFDSAYERLLSNSRFDLGKLYKNDSQFYVSAECQLEIASRYENLRISGFETTIGAIGTFYNERPEMYIDGNNIYLLNQPLEESREV